MLNVANQKCKFLIKGNCVYTECNISNLFNVTDPEKASNYETVHILCRCGSNEGKNAGKKSKHNVHRPH